MVKGFIKNSMSLLFILVHLHFSLLTGSNFWTLNFFLIFISAFLDNIYSVCSWFTFWSCLLTFHKRMRLTLFSLFLWPYRHFLCPCRAAVPQFWLGQDPWLWIWKHHSKMSHMVCYDYFSFLETFSLASIRLNNWLFFTIFLHFYYTFISYSPVFLNLSSVGLKTSDILSVHLFAHSSSRTFWLL